MGEVETVLLAEKIPFDNDHLERLRDEFNLVALAECGTRTVPGGIRLIPRAARRPLDRLRKEFNRWHIRYLPDSNIQSWLSERMAARPYDLLVGRYLRPTVRSGALSLSPVVVDVDDLDTQAYLSATALPDASSSEVRKQIRRAKSLDRTVHKWLCRPTHLWVTNEHDRQAVGPGRAAILPNIPFSPPAEPSPPESNTAAVLIVASIDHYVNARAIQRFLLHVWPQIKAQCPSAVLRIAGSSMNARQKADWSSVPGVEALGFVDDLRPLYADCAFAAVPIYEGGGTKIKVLEALSHGRSCVVTRHSHRGYEDSLRSGESLLVADTETQFADACVRLLRNPELRDALARHGSAQAARRFTYAAFERIVRDTVNKVCRHPSA
jgi:glycosyltransferase involved in cell wall biosynthesis